MALEIEVRVPWIRRRLKKITHRIEKYPKISWYLVWYQKLTKMIFGNSYEELDKELITLESEDRLSSLLQGLEVIKY